MDEYSEIREALLAKQKELSVRLETSRAISHVAEAQTLKSRRRSWKMRKWSTPLEMKRAMSCT